MKTEKQHPGTEITTSLEGDNVVIRLPIDLLVWSQEHRESGGLIIKNKKAMASYLKNRLLQSRYDSEAGTCALDRMIDDCFDEAYEDGEKWLREWSE